MFPVALSITTTIAMTVSSTAISITPATAVTSTNSSMISVIVTIVFWMAFYNVILRFFTVSDNNLFVPSSPVGSIFHTLHICMQVRPWFVYNDLVT